MPHVTIVHAYDPTMAPMGNGNSHCPAPFGRTPGMIAEPAAGFIVALHLPVGHPSDTREGQPLGDKVPQAIAQMATSPRPASLLWPARWRSMPPACVRRCTSRKCSPWSSRKRSIPSPTPEDVLRLLREESCPRARTPGQVHLAYASGDSRPVVERLMASLLGRGAARITSKGHRGTTVHMGMAVMAHHAATLVRSHEDRLSQRARQFRQRLRLRCRQVASWRDITSLPTAA